MQYLSFENGDLEYSINIEGRYTMTVSQQFVVATDGTDGDTVNFAFVRVPEGTSASSVTAATDGTEDTPANFTISSTTYTWSDDVPSGTGLLFAVKGTKAGTATGFTWGTPYRLEGTMAKELIIYSDVTITRLVTQQLPIILQQVYLRLQEVMQVLELNTSFFRINPSRWSKNTRSYLCSYRNYK